MVFRLNYKNKFEIDTSGNTDPTNVAAATWARLAAGINTFTPAGGDTADNTAYYDGNGYTSTDVTGKNYSINFAGHRIDGDPAQDYIASKDFSVGDDLKTLSRWTRPDGTVIIGCVTLESIVVSGGNANAKQTFSFQEHYNGAPVVTAGIAAPTGLAATPSANSVALTWGAVSGASMYHVYRNGTLIASPTTNAYTDSGLAASTQYTYQVTAVDENGVESTETAPVSATTLAG